jgi:quercetin dioxygenase-like cupin family protein
VSSASAVVTVDDDRTRVTTWTFGARDDDTGPHVHEYDYIVVPVTGGAFTVTAADGSTREMVQQAGSPYLGIAGTAHNVTSAGDAPATFVEVELKGQRCSAA